MTERGDEIITPDLDDVEQQPDDNPVFEVRSVPVCFDGPVQTQALPSRVSVMRSIPLTDTAEMLAGQDLRRARMVLIGTAEAATSFYVGTSNADVAGESAALWPTGLPLELLNAEAIYAKAQSTETVTLSLIIEQWAD